jgi:hypothetical protein
MIQILGSFSGFEKENESQKIAEYLAKPERITLYLKTLEPGLEYFTTFLLLDNLVLDGHG